MTTQACPWCDSTVRDAPRLRGGVPCANQWHKATEPERWEPGDHAEFLGLAGQIKSIGTRDNDGRPRSVIFQSDDGLATVTLLDPFTGLAKVDPPVTLRLSAAAVELLVYLATDDDAVNEDEAPLLAEIQAAVAAAKEGR